jgi:hypothetical protein
LEQLKFSLLGVKLEARKAGRKKTKAEEEAEFDMVSTMSFILGQPKI